MKEILPNSVKLAEEPGKEFCCETAALFDKSRWLLLAKARVWVPVQGLLKRRTKC